MCGDLRGVCLSRSLGSVPATLLTPCVTAYQAPPSAATTISPQVLPLRPVTAHASRVLLHVMRRAALGPLYAAVLPSSRLTVSFHSAPYLLNGWASRNSGVDLMPEGTAFLSGQQQGCAACRVLQCFSLWALTRCEGFSKISSRKWKCCQLNLSLDSPPVCTAVPGWWDCTITGHQPADSSFV